MKISYIKEQARQAKKEWQSQHDVRMHMEKLLKQRDSTGNPKRCHIEPPVLGENGNPKRCHIEPTVLGENGNLKRCHIETEVPHRD